MTQIGDFVDLKVPAKPEYVGIVRLTVSGIANRIGYSYDDIEDIKIAVAEACTNVVDHAYEDSGNIAVSFHVCDDRLEIIVADKGESYDLDELRATLGPIDVDKPIGELKEGGLGLFLINTLMDKVEISEESGVVIVMTKFLHRDGVEQDVDGISTSSTSN
ncbi:anti-sigma B factor RsbW [Desertibacillus haloalkaliphilus]|uniref:anti-sigma B factor RsbW n=1 Tax=Desertibacillus haloalkaliphilus TaxID=1328930 RepID=UPI001C262F4B|nr:anti-sigma B factor RsbW [Desertibacillus haloalkaliphilus]MBU8908758.1 anti-sigma B factor RsbW [Desertibacillus haloalkaliphilus]